MTAATDNQPGLTELFNLASTFMGEHDALAEKAVNKLLTKFVTKKAKSTAFKLLLAAADKQDPQGHSRKKLEAATNTAKIFADLVQGTKALQQLPKTVSGVVQGVKAAKQAKILVDSLSH